MHAATVPISHRSAHECHVHFHAHMHPAHATDSGRALSQAEEAALRDAVAVHGTHDWTSVGKVVGLKWPPWRLLQAFRKVEARLVTTERWDARRDEELLKWTQRLMTCAPAGRKISWLVCSRGIADVWLCVALGHVCLRERSGAHAACVQACQWMRQVQYSSFLGSIVQL
jgi:hypothetical protein